jgi:alpha-tubulin suppressor-like RCC1 family protein
VLERKRVVGVAAGVYHTVVWTDEGKAYSFGIGKFGQLGHGGEEGELVPRLIEGVLERKRVVGVATGSTHTVVWTDEGKAYSFGNGWCGQLGHGAIKHEVVPKLIERNDGGFEAVLVGKRVVGAAAGEHHTVVWTDEGKAYSFGNGGDGQLGHGSEEDEFAPRLIEGVHQ